MAANRAVWLEPPLFGGELGHGPMDRRMCPSHCMGGHDRAQNGASHRLA